MHILSGGLLGSLPKEQKRGEGEGKFYLWYCDKIVAAGQEGRGGKLKEEEGGRGKKAMISHLSIVYMRSAFRQYGSSPLSLYPALL